jgi:hypothetical protein
MDDKESVLGALANPKFEWRTVEGVSRDTQLQTDRVLQVIEAMPDLVIRSRVPDAQGRPLYTTREHYKETHSSLERLLYQFKTTST